MTIIATYRIDDQAIFNSDFRLTTRDKNNQKRQLDLSMKFIDIDKKIGLFLAGDVQYWKVTIPKISEIINLVTVGNILDTEGVFKQIIDSSAFKHTGGRSSAIGFMIDDITKKNIQFKIEINPGIGSLLDEIPTNKFIIIGSGANIPKLTTRVEKRLTSDLELFGKDLYQLGASMRDEIKQALKNSGSQSYEKLGISPFMAISTLSGSHFMIRGEEIKGDYFSDRGSYSFNYSFEAENNQILLKNYYNDTIQEVKGLSDMTPDLNGDIFDPEYLSKKQDPSSLFPKNNYVYLFHQWVVFEMKTVYRSIRRIDFVGNKRLCVMQEPIISILYDVEDGEIVKYPDCRDQYISINEEKDKLFNSELKSERLFDHVWLENFMEEYHNFYTS